MKLGPVEKTNDIINMRVAEYFGGSSAIAARTQRRLSITIDKEFLQLASLADDRIDLAHGALLIAKAAYPDLNESLYLKRLDRMAARVKLDMTTDTESADIITRLNYILFEQERFRGNRENYYDPDNSFLNRVLDRKMGSPSRAVKDWERYIANIGDRKSVTKIRARIENLKKQQSRLH